MTYYAKRGDAGSTTPETFLLNGSGGAVILTGASVRFLMRAADSSTPKVAAAAQIVDAATGQVRYTWIAADLDTPGVYRAEWEVTYSGGAKETFPADGWIAVVVRDHLDD
jgi:hypothetical protein